MAEKRDSVNRYKRAVVLPVTSSLPVGTTVELWDLEEATIDCKVRDAMAMKDPVDGNAVGDAIFDAEGATNACDASL